MSRRKEHPSECTLFSPDTVAEAQRNCLSDYLNLVSVEEEDSEYRRGGYLPWEHDEYRELYATEMDYRDYGRMLIRRYREREGI